MHSTSVQNPGPGQTDRKLRNRVQGQVPRNVYRTRIAMSPGKTYSPAPPGTRQKCLAPRSAHACWPGGRGTHPHPEGWDRPFGARARVGPRPRRGWPRDATSVPEPSHKKMQPPHGWEVARPRTTPHPCSARRPQQKPRNQGSQQSPAVCNGLEASPGRQASVR